MTMTPQNIAAALAARPEAARLGNTRLARDQGAFKAMLTSQLGVSQDVLGRKAAAPLSMLGANQDGPGSGPAGPPAPAAASMGQVQAAAAKASPPAAGQAKSGNPVLPLALSGSPKIDLPVVPASVMAARNASRPAAKAVSEVRGAIVASNRHPDDLGHLPSKVKGMVQTGGFTKEEEDLLLAAAAAESKFMAAKRQAVRARGEAAPGSDERIGALSAIYESRGAIDAIGYDGRGGTSYGKYQIASGVGTMGRFLDYLDAKAPDISARLSRSGPANTGGRGGSMAGEWKRIAQESPKRFEALQHEFIRDTHYQPALKSITLVSGEDVSKRSQAVREVLWSTAVQHGPSGAADIFSSALDKLQDKGKAVADKALIEEVYAQRMTQFAGRGRLRVAVTTRLSDEKDTALAMLGGKSAG
jgi:hypothetical protein